MSLKFCEYDAENEADTMPSLADAESEALNDLDEISYTRLINYYELNDNMSKKCCYPCIVELIQ